MNRDYYISPFVPLVTASQMPYPKLVIHDTADSERNERERSFHTAYRLFLQQLVDFITQPHVTPEKQKQLIILLQKLIEAKSILDTNHE